MGKVIGTTVAAILLNVILVVVVVVVVDTLHFFVAIVLWLRMLSGERGSKRLCYTNYFGRTA